MVCILLFSGHGAIGTFLAKIGVIENSRMLVVRGRQNRQSSTCTCTQSAGDGGDKEGTLQEV